jgi:diguanylate cyclase (GGDEF)-like protein
MKRAKSWQDYLLGLDDTQKNSSWIRERAEKALLSATQSQDVHGIAEAHLALTNAFMRENQYSQAQTYLEQALVLLRELDLTDGLVRALMFKASIDNEQGSNNQALWHLQDALDVLARSPDAILEARVWHVLGIVYADLDETDVAKQHYQRSLAIGQAVQPVARTCATLNNIGLLLMNQGDPVLQTDIRLSRQYLLEAKVFFEHSLALATKIKSLNLEVITRQNLAITVALLGDFEIGLSMLKMALSAAKKQRSQHNIAMINADIGRLFLDSKKSKLALPFFLHAIKNLEELGERTEIMRVHLDLSRVYEALHKYKLALEHFKLHHQFSNQVRSEAATQYAQTMQSQLELERERARALQLEQQNVSLALESRLDALTQIANRRALEEDLERLWLEAQQSGLPLAVVVADIDHFKLVNDQFSHSVGDLVLQQCALLLRRQVRHLDVLARFGGEEFVLLLPNLDEKSAYRFAQRCRKVIAQHTWQVLEPNLTVTMSFGFASASHAASAQALFRLADDALFKAKKAGRNRVRPVIKTYETSSPRDPVRRSIDALPQQ